MPQEGVRRATESRRGSEGRRATRWPLLAIALVVLIAAAGAVVAATRDAHTRPHPNATKVVPPSKKPNIVMIVTDDMRPDELAYMPHVRRLLVDQGTWFTRAISPHPTCCPARAELTTGEYAQNNGVHDNAGAYGGYPALKRPNDNLGAWMQRAGYWTGFVGKWLNSYTGQRRIRGWDRWQAAIGDVYRYHVVRYYGGRAIHGYVAGTTTRFADRTIDAGAASGKPFYVVANYLAPHDAVGAGFTVTAPVPDDKYAGSCDHLEPAFLRSPAFRTAVVNGMPTGMTPRVNTVDHYVTEARNRACALKSVDDGVARIVGHLKAIHHLDDTDIVFISDNGFNLGEHYLYGKNLITDESLDVPVIARGPHFPAGLRSDVPVSLVDLPATYLQLAGATAGRPPDGLSILDLMTAQVPKRDTLLVQTGDEVADSTPGFAYRGVSTERYLYAIDPSHPGQGLLFDRLRDPHALTNRFADARYADVRDALQDRLEALMSCSGADCNRVFGRLPRPGA